MERPSRRHREIFWCSEVNRSVSVEFVQEGRWPLRRETAIVSCSAFERPGLMNCRRACLDPASRRALCPGRLGVGLWDPFLDVTARRTTSSS